MNRFGRMALAMTMTLGATACGPEPGPVTLHDVGPLGAMVFFEQPGDLPGVLEPRMVFQLGVDTSATRCFVGTGSMARENGRQMHLRSPGGKTREACEPPSWSLDRSQHDAAPDQVDIVVEDASQRVLMSILEPFAEPALSLVAPGDGVFLPGAGITLTSLPSSLRLDSEWMDVSYTATGATEPAFTLRPQPQHVGDGRIYFHWPDDVPAGTGMLSVRADAALTVVDCSGAVCNGGRYDRQYRTFRVSIPVNSGP